MSVANIQVLITGAGPTGLSMGNLLARMDIPFLLIDQKPYPSRESKAFGVHARTLEIFDQLGIAQKAVKQGNIDNTVHLLIRNKEAAKIRLGEIIPGESSYPYFLILAQNKTEQLLADALESLGQKVQWEHELTYIREEGEGIRVRIKEPSGEEKELYLQYLIGCDGAGSFVREQAGFSFEGKTYSPTFYLADGELDWEKPHGDIYFSLAPGYLSGIFSFAEENKYRIFNFLNSRVNKKEGNLSPEDFQQILDSNPWLYQQLKNPDWFSVFKIHSRITNRFQKGRIFLAGDAAHVHSPAGGQGMNTGIQDAYNLAWKLALVVKGTAAPALLDTYHEERHLIAQNLHRTTDRFFQLMIQQSKLGEFFRLWLFPKGFRFVTGIEWLRQRVLRRASQIAIKYRFSSLSHEGSAKGFYRKAPKAGDRAPYTKIRIEGRETDIFQLFKCTHFSLLIGIADPEDHRANRIASYFQTYAKLPLEVHILSKMKGGYSFHQFYGIKKEAMFLIRPDGHICFRTASLEQAEIDYYLDLMADRKKELK